MMSNPNEVTEDSYTMNLKNGVLYILYRVFVLFLHNFEAL